MKNVLGLVNLQEETRLICELSRERPVGMLPFGGRYRLIDFVLSNMVNSGIKDVGIFLPGKSRAVLDHIRSGKEWDLARHHGGLMYLPPVKSKMLLRAGTLKNLYYNLDFVDITQNDFVLIGDGNFVYNMNYTEAMDFHIDKRADITLVYGVTPQNGLNGITLRKDEDGRLTAFLEKPVVEEGNNLFLGIAMMSRRLYVELVRDTYEQGGSDFFFDGIMRNLRKLSVYAYEHKGYAREISSTTAYYQASLDLLKPEVYDELFLSGERIYTKAKNLPPVHYRSTSSVKNSLIASGSDIAGEVENSVIFRGVKIGRDVKIKNSIIMQGCVFEQNTSAENIICDKNVMVKEGKVLMGAPEYPIIIEKNAVIG